MLIMPASCMLIRMGGDWLTASKYEACPARPKSAFSNNGAMRALEY